MSRDLHAASFAYPAIPSAGRARLSLAKPGAGVFRLATCLRVEFAAWTTADEFSAHLADMGASDVPGARNLTGVEAAAHLYRVAAGLESAVVGEPEVLSQFRAAVADTKGHNATHGLFVKLLESAIATGRQTRDLLPYSPHDSLAAISAQFVGACDQVAVLGSGAMARAVIAALRHLPAPPSVIVAVRSPEQVRLPGVHVVPFEQATKLLSEVSGVVSATAAKVRLLDAEAMNAILAERRTPLTLVDMAMPPDFAPAPHLGMHYIDIDELARRAATHQTTDRAEAFVASEAAVAYRRIADHVHIRHAATALLNRAADAADRAVHRYAGRFPDDEQRAVLERAVHVATRSLVANPLQALGDGDPQLRDAAQTLFDLDSET